MKKCIYRFASGLLVIITLLTSAACKPGTPITSLDPNLPSTRIVPQQGDMIQKSMGSLAAMSQWDVIRESDAAFIGTVKEILPSQLGAPDSRGHRLAYTDVTIIPERYLFGSGNKSVQVVRVYGGRVENTCYWVEDEATFTATEKVLVFVRPLAFTASDNSSSILRTPDFRFKYRIEGDTAIQDETNRTEKLAIIEAMASLIKR